MLTGSARLLGLRDLPHALPGRAETIELWPLSQGEIDSAPDGFVDTVLECADGTVIGVEVKAAETVRAEDFRGLRHLANRLGDRFPGRDRALRRGQQLSFDGLSALPMAAWWMLDGSSP